MTQLAKNLVYLRNKYKISQSILASYCKVTEGAVCRWEKGNRQIDDKYLPILSTIFHVTEHDFKYKDLTEL